MPPTLHCETPNPQIPFDDAEPARWCERPRRSPAETACAGVNSFGFGGTNAHAVLAAAASGRDAPMPAAADDAAAGDLGPDRSVAARAGAQAGAHARRDAAGRDSGLAARRRARPRSSPAPSGRRSATIRNERSARSPSFLADATHAGDRRRYGGARRQARLRLLRQRRAIRRDGPRRVARQRSVSRRRSRRWTACCGPQLGWSVGELIERGVDAEARGARRYRPAAAVRDPGRHRRRRCAGSGSTPPGYLGHSVGEIAAAWAAGALSLADAARVVVARSRHQERTRGSGRMAALALAARRRPRAARRARQPARDRRAQCDPVGDHLRAGRGDRAARRRSAAPRSVRFAPLDLDFAFHSRGDGADPRGSARRASPGSDRAFRRRGWCRP